jgi:hypothetical protein
MRTFICIAALLAFMTGASAAMHGGGGHGGGHGGGFHGAMHGGGFHGGGFRGGFRGGRGFHGGGPGFWYGGAWCTWPQYYAGLCTFD